MATQNRNPETTDNSDARMKDLHNRLRGYGREDARSGTGRPKAALDLADAAREGLTGVDKDFAAKAFADYAAGVAEAAKDNPLICVNPDPDQKSAAQQTSKFRQFILAGAIPGFDVPSILRQAAAIAKDMAASGTAVKSPFDAMLDTARAQLKSPKAALTKEQLEAIVIKPAKKDKSDIDKMIDLYKRTYKMQDTFPDNEALERAADDMREAIIEAGGDVPAMTDAEKEEEQMMKLLAKRGLTVVPAVAAE